MSKLRKLQELSASEWWLLAQAQVLLPLTLTGVYLFGVSRWQSVLAKLAKLRTVHAGGAEAAAENSQKTPEIARMVSVAATFGIFRARCLQRSLVLWCLLERNGVRSEIRYGARKEDGELQAHAWVEIDGVPLHDEMHRDFSTFEEIPRTNP